MPPMDDLAPPPAYDAAVAFSDQHLPTGGDEKKQRPFSDDADGPSSSQSLAGSSRLPTASPRPFASTRPRPSPNTSSSGGGPLAALSSYLGFATVDDRTTLAVRTTVLALLRDVIANSSDASATVLVLQNCQDSCRERGIDFEALAQERSIEGKAPIYWAIIKRDPKRPGRSEVLDFLISFRLTPEAREDAISACLSSNDNDLYQTLLVANPTFDPSNRSTGVTSILNLPTPSSAIVLASPPSVNEASSSTRGSFHFSLAFPAFPVRVRAGGTIAHPFVAHNRLWKLTLDLGPSEPVWTLEVLQGEPIWVKAGVAVADESVSSKEEEEGKGVKKSSRGRGCELYAWEWKATHLQPSSRIINGGQLPAYKAVIQLASCQGGPAILDPDFAYLSPEGTLRVTGDVALFTRFPDAECCIM